MLFPIRLISIFGIGCVKPGGGVVDEKPGGGALVSKPGGGALLPFAGCNCDKGCLRCSSVR